MAIPATRNPDPTTDKPPRRRRWIPLSLRIFVVFLVLASVGGGSWIALQAHWQQAAIRELKSAGANVDESIVAPEPLRRWIGDERLKSFALARSVRWNRPMQVQDARSLVNVRSLRSLEELMIGGPGTTDAVMQHVEGLTYLKSLHLECSPITDRGMRSLRRLTRLQVLNVSNTGISDEALNEVGCLTALRELDLHNTWITDAGVEKIARLKFLKRIDLAGTQITDAGLIRLEAMSSLKNVNVNGSKVSETGILLLKQAIPEVEILR